MVPHLAELTEIVRGVLCDSDLELTAACKFDELSGWDSMNLIAVVVEAECRFGLLFEPEEIELLYTIADLLHAIAAKRALASV